MLLKTSTGGNLIRTTSSTSAGFECKLNFVYIFCNLFTFHFFFHACAQWGPPFFGVQARLDSTLLKTDAKCAELFLACCGGDSENKPIADIFVQLRFFDRVITPVALFAAGHRAIRMSDLCKLHFVYGQMLRMIVGPPNFVEWNAPWHDILHHWNGKAVALAQQHGLNTWSEQCLKHPWKFAMHVANSPSNRWVKRVLLWSPAGA